MSCASHKLIAPNDLGKSDPDRPSLARASLAHYWEDNVFPDREPPTACRERCVYSGLPRDRVGHKPFLLACVTGVDEHGRQFQWIARRARKRVLQPYQCTCPPPPVSWLGTLSWKSCKGKPGWWVAMLFGLGSLMFLATGIARETKPVSLPEVYPPGLTSLAAALSTWPELMACYLLFFPGTILQVLESTNMDYDCRVRTWEKGGRLGPAPWPRVLPSAADLHTVSFWTAGLQVIAMLGFNMALTVELVYMARGVAPAVERWMKFFPFFIGGGLFAVASALGGMEETGSYWRGLVPTRMSHVRSISWLAVFFGFHGSVGFCFFGGVFFFYGDWGWTQIQWIIGYGQIAASVFFLISAVAGLLEQANPGHL